MQRAAKYDFADRGIPSFADVVQRVRMNPTIPERRRGQLLSSAATLIRLADIQAETTPFTPLHLRAHLAKLTPGSTGRSKKRLQNIRSDVNSIAGYLEVGGSRRYLARLTPAWAALEALLNRYESTSLSRLMQFASAQDVDPTDVDDAFATRFLQAMEHEEILKDPRTTHKNAIRAWNKAAQRFEHWPKRQLAVPFYRSFWGLAWSAFKPELEQAVDDFLGAGQDPTAIDIFDESAPFQRLRATTIKTQKEHFRMAATILAATSPSSLADLCNPAAFKLVISAYLQRYGKITSYIAQIGWTLTKAARHGGVLDPKDVAEVDRLFRKVSVAKVADNRTRVDRDQLVLDQFDDPALMNAFLSLPSRIIEKVLKGPRRSRREAMLFQLAFAIELWVCVPLRIGNFIQLNHKVHVKRESGGRGQVVIRIPSDDVKNREETAHYLHDDLVKMLDIYVEEFLPLLTQSEEGWLWPGRNGTPKNASPFRQQIEKLLKQELGIDFHPHLFRKLATKIILDNDENDLETASRCLGQRSERTTRQAYKQKRDRKTQEKYTKLVIERRLVALREYKFR